MGIIVLQKESKIMLNQERIQILEGIDGWKEFVEKSFRETNKKQMILELPLTSPRPQWGTPLGTALRYYTTESQPSYDKNFDELVRQKYPTWFIRSQQKKIALLALPKGCRRPVSAALIDYTGKNTGSYDPEFDKKIREKQPQWFVKTSIGNKICLLSMPTGLARPTKYTKIGCCLKRYTRQGSSCYDPKFDKSIRKKHPQWFINTSDENKKALWSLPRGNKPSPILVRALYSYTRKNSDCYDPEFDKAIRAKHPEWFVDIVEEKKKVLLSMPSGCRRLSAKASKIFEALARYTRKNSYSYDPEFDKIIRVKQPQWFIKTADENKKALLSLPKNSPPPSISDRIRPLLRQGYTQKNSDSYDHEFDRAIRIKQPQWFRKKFHE